MNKELNTNETKSHLFQVKLSDFSGPFDVLLELIESKKVPLSEVNVLELVNQYIEFFKYVIKDIPLEELAEYMYVHAHLLKLKTKLILNETDLDIKLGKFEDGKDLLNRMIEYQKYKNSVVIFQKLLEERNKLFTKKHDDYDEYKLSEIPTAELPKSLDIAKLQQIYQDLIDKIIEDSLEDSTELFRTNVTFVQYSIKDIQQKICNYLLQLPNHTDDFKNCFLNNLDQNLTKGYFSAFFLAILTMIRYSIIIIEEDKKTNNFIIKLSKEDYKTLLSILNNEENE